MSIFRSRSGPFSVVMVLVLFMSTLVVGPVGAQDAEPAPTTQAPATSEAPASTEAPTTTTEPPPPPLVQGDPLHVINFVYLDLDGDGVRDAGEVGLAGVTVHLRTTAGAVIATKQTNANGRYVFLRADGVVAGTDYTVTFDTSTNTTSIPGGFFNSALSVSNQPVRAGRVNDSGVTTPFDVALRVTVDRSRVNRSARTVPFTLTIVNQGQTIENFAIVNYLDYGANGAWADFVPGLNPSSSAGGRSWSWNSDNPQRPVVSVNGVLATGQQINIPFIVRFNEDLPNNTSQLELWAEILNFDDGDPSTGTAATGALRDRDSTPDRSPTNDNQPSGPGASTDDAIDGRSGDEDDHDVAGLGLFDLSLTQALRGGVDAVIPGSQVTFAINVSNDGLVDATGVTLVDYLPPEGMRLADPDWRTVSDGTARYAIPGTISPGQSRTVDITFVVERGVTGGVTNTAEIARATASIGGRSITGARDTDSTPGNNRSGEDDRASASIRIGFFDLSVSTTVAGGYDVGSAPIGNAVVFEVEVINEGTVNATDIELINYLPDEGMVLVDPDWSTNGNGTASLNTPIAGPIPPGRSVVVPITFLVNYEASGTIYNWVEIRAADTDGVAETPAPVDVDSRPGNNRIHGGGPSVMSDATQEPVVPQAPDTSDNESGDADSEEDSPNDETSNDEVPEDDDGDELADEAAGGGSLLSEKSLEANRSEDDHDVAAVEIDDPVFDLAVRVAIDRDVDVDDLGIEDPVTFVVTVENEGNIFADEVELVNYLPSAGLALSDDSWAEDGTRAFYTLSNPLPPGSAVEVEVDFVVTSGAVGTIRNAVEIAGAIPVDLSGRAIRDEAGDRLVDVDSVPLGDLPGNPSGSEDDYGFAAITFEPPPVFDLAIFSDLTNGSERSLFAPGDEVSYDLTVLNQGVVTTREIKLELEIPEGFTLRGRDWEVDDDRAELIIDGPLAAGELEMVEVIFRAEAEAFGNIDVDVRIAGSLSVDLTEGSMLGADGVQLLDVDPSDDQTTVGLSVIPTLAFRGVDTNWGVTFSWGFLALAMIAGMIWLALSSRNRERTIPSSFGRPVPTTSRWG